MDDEPNIRDVLTQVPGLRGLSDILRRQRRGWTAGSCANASPRIISDVLMPGMDGYEFCQHVREASDVPILMLSGQVDMEEEEDKVQSMKLGAVLTP